MMDATTSQICNTPHNREELLKGLKTVRWYLKLAEIQFVDYMSFERQIESSFSNQLDFVPDISSDEYNPTHSFPKRTCLTVGIYVAFATAVLGIGKLVQFSAMSSKGIPSNLGPVFAPFSLAVTVLVVFFALVVGIQLRHALKAKISYFEGFGVKALIVFVLVWANMTTLPSLFSGLKPSESTGLVYAVVVALAFFVSVLQYQKDLGQTKAKAEENRLQIEEFNNVIAGHNYEIAQHIEELQNKETQVASKFISIIEQMRHETGNWYPQDYYYPEAIERFISIVQNYKADTVKEMVNIYDEERFRRNLLAHQQLTTATLMQAVHNQQKMMALQKESNYLQLGEVIIAFANE